MHKPNFISILLSGVAFTLLLSAVGCKTYGPNPSGVSGPSAERGTMTFDPYGIPPPSGERWTMTFDDEFTHDTSINKSKWNGGAGDTDWCSVSFPVRRSPGTWISGGAWMFRQITDPCGQHYSGLTFSSTNGLEMRSAGFPSAAIQTGGTTARDAKFIQKFGYWEARFKVPRSTNGEGKGVHSDFWMHPIPEGIRSPVEWTPEIDVGERPVWKAKLESANNKVWFGIFDYGKKYSGPRPFAGHTHGGYYGTSPLTDLSAHWHRYGLYWKGDGSGPYGSMQFYLDGKPLGSPYTLSSLDTNMANGIYIFLSLDNNPAGDHTTSSNAKGANNPFLVQYVRVWRLAPNSRSGSSSSSPSGTRKKSGVSQ